MTKYLLVCIGCFLGMAAAAQQPDILFEHVPIPGTIRSSQVNDIVQDHHGLIWLAGDGLFRYDGYTFTAYTEISPTQSIGGKEIICLMADERANKLYLGTHSYGLVEYNYDTDKLTLVPSKGGVPIISMITQTSDGQVWAGSFSNGLYRLEQDSLKKFPDRNRHFVNPSHLRAIGKYIYIDRLKDVSILENGKVVDTIVVQYPGVEFPLTTRITAINLDRSGKIWIGTERSGVLVYDTLSKSFVKYFSTDTAPFYHRINKIMTAADGNTWILTKANGLVVYNPTTDSYQHLTKNPMSDHSLSGNNCTSIIQDKTGIIWIGSSGDLNKYDPSKIKFRHIYNNPFSALSLNDNMVRSVYEDKSEKLWIGTDGGMVHIFDRKNAKLEKVPVVISGNTQHIVPFSFQQFSDNIMLVGTSIGLLQYDQSKKVFTFFKPLENFIPKNQQVRQIIFHSNKLYFTQTGSLFIYDFSTGNFKSYSTFGSDAKKASTLYIDRQDRLWVGTLKGLSLFHPDTETFSHYELEKNTKRPLGTYLLILSIHEHEGKIWVGTFNSGLWVFDFSNATSPTLKNYNSDNGLPDNTVYATLPDASGNMWMSTNQGICKYDAATQQFLNFTQSDGIQHEEFNRLAYTQCQNGEIVFGGINGINIFDPEQISVKEEDYTPRIIAMSVLDPEANKSTFNALFTSKSASLDPDEKNLVFHFFIPNYRSPRQFDVYAKLSGYDPDWVKTEGNKLNYSNLQPGSYTLTLKTVSGNGVEKLTHFSFYIHHPFWQNWWFILLTMMGVTLSIYFLVRRNITKTKQDKEQLEKLLRLRTQEIEKSREQLENLNQKKDVIFSILSHDLRAPLTTLKGFLSLLIDSADYLSKEEMKKHATNIRTSVTSSLDLIDNTLFWSLSQTGNITYTPTKFLLNPLFEKITNLYQLTAEKKHIHFTIDGEDNIMIYADENMVYVTLRNLVSNALKFTPEGKSITIRSTKNHQSVEIRIKDEGMGMSKAYLDKLLNEEHFQVKLGTANEKGTGLGIALCKKFIHMNQGELTITSEEGRGSEFMVKLPLAQD